MTASRQMERKAANDKEISWRKITVITPANLIEKKEGNIKGRLF